MERQTGKVYKGPWKVIKEPHGSLKNVVIAVDFDGTVVDHAYPLIGAEVPQSVESLKYLQLCGAEIILWTMRSGSELEEAELWFAERGVKLFAVNKNPDQDSWTRSPKVYATYYIDDAAVGCPLLYPPEDDIGARPVVDWRMVVDMLVGK